MPNIFRIDKKLLKFGIKLDMFLWIEIRASDIINLIQIDISVVGPSGAPEFVILDLRKCRTGDLAGMGFVDCHVGFSELDIALDEIDLAVLRACDHERPFHVWTIDRDQIKRLGNRVQPYFHLDDPFLCEIHKQEPVIFRNHK
jgi:hypothetical protein